MLDFSVLMSVYKKEKPEYLKQAIESIVNQTLMPNEIVIVKDGPLTHELELVISYYKKKYNSLFKIIDFNQNRGLGLALRDSVLACNNEYIARMDTDDIALPTRFEKQFAYLEKHKEIALLGSWITEFSDDPEHPETITELPFEHKDIVQYAKRRNPFRHMTVIFKKSAVLDSGNYRDFLWFEDYDLWVRMIQKGYKVANISEVLVNVRAGDDMFARRGGLRYLKQDVNFQLNMKRLMFINDWIFIQNIFVRGLVRILPLKFRIWIYKHKLRGVGERNA